MDIITDQALDTIKSKVKKEAKPFVIGVLIFNIVLFACLFYIIMNLRKLTKNIGTI
jgi:hypothetical protein